MSTRSYDPAQVILNVNGVDASGFADGTFIKVERNVDAFSLVVGADGEATRVKSHNRSGRFTFTLQQSSPFNDYLSSLASADETSSTGVAPILVKENGGKTLAQASKAWVVKKSAVEFGKESGTREWIMETGDMALDVGGSAAL
jgi:hypothetical protein